MYTYVHTGSAGEMFTSAASFDPTFWPLHGAAERLIGYKRALLKKGVLSTFDETWGYPEFDKSSGAAYVPGICDWSGVDGVEDLTLPTCTLGNLSFNSLNSDNFMCICYIS